MELARAERLEKSFGTGNVRSGRSAKRSAICWSLRERSSSASDAALAGILGVPSVNFFVARFVGITGLHYPRISNGVSLN